MPDRLTRRQLLAATGGAALSLPFASGATFRKNPRYKAIAFDAFALFDPRPVFGKVMKSFPEKGAEIVDAWRTHQFEYTWLRASAHRYVDFWQVTDDALLYALKKAQVDLSPAGREELMQAYLQLPVWPDVRDALDELKRAGLRLALLTNFSPKMLHACVQANALDATFERLLSTDEARTFKPDPKAYELGTKALGLKREEILFVPFAAWDAAGAKQYGYPTFWVNRQNQLPEELGASVDGMGTSLHDLVRFVL